MGEKFVLPPPFDIEVSYKDSQASTPMIFVLPGADPLSSMAYFAKTKYKYDSMKIISLGQGEGPKAEKAIEEAKKIGGWVLL
jgi:dynein heavy chain